MKVTEKVFAIAASVRNEGFLHKVSEFCGMASTPKNWLDIARLYNAAIYSDIVGNSTIVPTSTYLA